MNKTYLEFDVACSEQNFHKSLIVFAVNRINARVRNTNIGQFIRSYPFELNFPANIGKSKWTVLLFLNGQYENGKPNGMINIYLKLEHCEHQSAELEFDVTFQIGSEYAKTTKKNQRICFANAKTRWIGAKLINFEDMMIYGSQYIRDDILMLSVQLDEHLPPTIFGSIKSNRKKQKR